MALADDVQNRIPSQELYELTNPNSAGATSVNTTYLGYAVTDVQAEFELTAEVEYDSTDAKHVALGVEGVVARLKWYSRTGGVGNAAGAAWTDWLERLATLKNVTSRRRVTPRTSQETTPSSELPTSTSTVKPWADHKRFADYQVDPPGGDDPASGDDDD